MTIICLSKSFIRIAPLHQRCTLPRSNFKVLVYTYGRSWCMRFEGKHNYFKDLAHRVKCFTNIEKSLPSRHQRLVCYQLATQIFLRTNFEPGILCVNIACLDSLIVTNNVYAFPSLVTTATVSSITYGEEYSHLFPDSTHVSRYAMLMLTIGIHTSYK